MDPTDADMEDLIEGYRKTPRKTWKMRSKPDKVEQICEYFLETDCVEDVANKFKLSNSQVHAILEKQGFM